MPSTTIHISDELLSRIDEIVKEKGMRRNRFIIEACEMALSKNAGRWPANFFQMNLNQKELRVLRDAVSEMEKSILNLRKNRTEVVLS